MSKASRGFCQTKRVVLLFFSLHALLCMADTPDAGVQLDVVPQTLELDSCQTGARMLAIARNPTAYTATDVAITTFADVPLTLAPEPAVVKTLGPGQQTAWNVLVTCQSDFRSGSLQVVLSAKVAGGGTVSLAQIATKSVSVKLRDPQAMDGLAAFDVKSTLESLASSDKGELNIVVTNKTISPIKINIRPAGPSFIKFDPEEDNNVNIGPLSTVILPFTVRATTRVKPGKQFLIFNVHLRSDSGPERDYLLTREVTVGVLGESDIFKLLGVPSLLLLPGFLAVSSFLLLWHWQVLRPPGNAAIPLEEKSSGFWLVSITASLLISGAFSLFRADFFTFYGLQDLVMVWVVSIGLGCGVYLAWRAIFNYMQRTKYPDPRDTPLAVLLKLKPRTNDVAVPRVKVKGLKDPAFLLMWNALGSSAFVAPQMELVWGPKADPALRLTVQKQLTRGGNLRAVAQVIEAELNKIAENKSASVKEFKWDTSDPLNAGPHKINKEEIEGVEEHEIVLREI